jgi:predicted permease
MLDVLLQMAGLIACGVVWRVVNPGSIDVEVMRRALTSLVYNLLLPALVLSVLWRAPLDGNTLVISFLAASGVLTGVLLGWISCRLCGSPHVVTGAVILAAAFPNATYLGLPVLEASFGSWARAVAIQYDLFACLPLLLTLGILIARHYGSEKDHDSLLKGLIKVPPLWAAIVAAILNLTGVPLPAFGEEWLSRLGVGVSVLMLISLGMSLRWNEEAKKYLPVVFPVALIQLVLMPAMVWFVSHLFDLPPLLLSSIIIEAAMPSMVLGLVICDRYGLNVNVYASAVTVSTALSLFSLSMWFTVLGVGVM